MAVENTQIITFAVLDAIRMLNLVNVSHWQKLKIAFAWVVCLLVFQMMIIGNISILKCLKMQKSVKINAQQDETSSVSVENDLTTSEKSSDIEISTSALKINL